MKDVHAELEKVAQLFGITEAPKESATGDIVRSLTVGSYEVLYELDWARRTVTLLGVLPIAAALDAEPRSKAS